jgi:hypothetical protein
MRENLADGVDILRTMLLDGLAPEQEVADALGVSTRTVQRLGLPFIRLGRRRMYVVDGSRKKIRCEEGAVAACQGPTADRTDPQSLFG